MGWIVFLTAPNSKLSRMGVLVGRGWRAFLLSHNETNLTEVKWWLVSGWMWVRYCLPISVLFLEPMRSVLFVMAASGGTFCAPSAFSLPTIRDSLGWGFKIHVASHSTCSFFHPSLSKNDHKAELGFLGMVVRAAGVLCSLVPTPAVWTLMGSQQLLALFFFSSGEWVVCITTIKTRKSSLWKFVEGKHSRREAASRFCQSLWPAVHQPQTPRWILLFAPEYSSLSEGLVYVSTGEQQQITYKTISL